MGSTCQQGDLHQNIKGALQVCITMPTVSKADTVVDATMHLAKVLKNKIKWNTREKNIDQLWQLVDALRNTGTKTHDKWAVQKSETIPKTHGQTRLTSIEKRMYNTQDLKQKMTEQPPPHSPKRWLHQLISKMCYSALLTEILLPFCVSDMWLNAAVCTVPKNLSGLCQTASMMLISHDFGLPPCKTNQLHN